MLRVVCAAPAMDKSTAGVEPAGGAEKATAAKLDAFERKASGATGGTRGSEQGREAIARQSHMSQLCTPLSKKIKSHPNIELHYYIWLDGRL